MKQIEIVKFQANKKSPSVTPLQCEDYPKAFPNFRDQLFMK